MQRGLRTHVSPIYLCSSCCSGRKWRDFFHFAGHSVSLTLPALRQWEVWREQFSKELVCLLPPASQPEEEPTWPQGNQRLHGCRDLDPLPDASSGRRERCDGLMGRDEDFLMYLEHQTNVQSRLSVDALHS